VSSAAHSPSGAAHAPQPARAGPGAVAPGLCRGREGSEDCDAAHSLQHGPAGRRSDRAGAEAASQTPPRARSPPELRVRRAAAAGAHPRPPVRTARRRQPPAARARLHPAAAAGRAPAARPRGPAGPRARRRPPRAPPPSAPPAQAGLLRSPGHQRDVQPAHTRTGALRTPRRPARHLQEHMNIAVWDDGGKGGRAARRPRPPRAPPPVAPPAPAAQARIGWSRVHACWTEGGRQPRKARASGSVAVSRPSSPAPRAAAAPSTPSAQSAPRAGGGSGAPPAASTAWRAARQSRARLGRGHTMMLQHTVAVARRAFAGTPAASDTYPELSQAAARLRPPGWMLYAGSRGSPARSAPSPAAARRQPAAACPAGTQPRQAGAAQARPGAQPPAPAARPRRPRAPAPPPPPRLGTRAARRRLPRRTPCVARGRLSMTA